MARKNPIDRKKGRDMSMMHESMADMKAEGEGPYMGKGGKKSGKKGGKNAKC